MNHCYQAKEYFFQHKFLKELADRSVETDKKVTEIVSEIIDNVRKNGDKAVKEYTEKFDGKLPEYYEVPREVINTALTEADEEFSNNPIITEIAYENPSKMTPYGEDCDRLHITFMGESKPIAEINSLSSSGSGWFYGAHAWVVCKETKELEELTSW